MHPKCPVGNWECDRYFSDSLDDRDGPLVEEADSQSSPFNLGPRLAASPDVLKVNKVLPTWCFLAVPVHRNLLARLVRCRDIGERK
jgi:hypothetical protein